MKQFSKIINSSTIIIIVLLLCSPAYSQDWQLGGNPNPPMNTGNNFLGSDATNNIPIRLGTFGIPRIFINDNTGPTAGFVGIGLPTPLFLLDVQDNINVNTTGFLNGYRINGFTVLQTPGLENVFVGRGSAANFTGSTLGQNTFVGFNAGGSYISSNTSGGDRNTFVGRAAGFANVAGRFNTFIGCDAGLSLVSGNENTFVGEHAGFRQVSGDNNTYVGGHSGQGTLNSTGSNNTFTGAFCGPAVNNGNENTFAGMRAGNNCSTGDQNCFYGNFSGLLTNGGSRNVFMGYLADRFNRGGNDNTFVGNLAGVPTGIPFQNLNNANGFGSGATATASNTMILGDNSVNVGIGLSGNLVSPSNKLEINANAANLSGLTFRQLPGASASLTAINPGPGVLALGTNGEVIYVPGGGGSTFFTCGTSVAGDSLPFDSWWELNNKNFVFSGQGTVGNNVGIGTICTPTAKLDVLQNSGSPSGSIGINVENTDLSGGTPATSVVGVRSVMPDTSDFYRIAGMFDAPELPGTQSTSIFVPQLGGKVSIGYPSPYFNTPGLLEVNGPIYMSGLLVTASDESWKTNITNIDSATAKIKKLNGIYYYWDTINNPTMNFESRRQVGFVAQNVDSVLPELVRTDANGKKYVVYDRVVALLAEGMKEQQLKMDSLTQAIIAMQSQINSCCNSNERIQNPNLNQTDVTLTNSESIVLNQNVPNPFAEQTTITYNLPESVQKAQLLFYDATGKLIKSVDLTARGNGQINVFANDLSNGIYSYALVVDGQIADTKRMVKTN